ncbi:hypothetical protein [Sutcliffiella horikoshii]|uniref:hypothetical protein n=1 Tax=Sutcliffiella horikoshii TaxID=79883 RepID=UPI0012F8F79A|nr:hypothetical protein [Sutcliffiella horikoshii]
MGVLIFYFRLFKRWFKKNYLKVVKTPENSHSALYPAIAISKANHKQNGWVHWDSYISIFTYSNVGLKIAISENV